MEADRRRIGAVTALLIAALALAGALASPAAAAPPEEFWEREVNQFSPGARGVAADPSTGHVFVGEQSGARVVEFTAWGEFVKAWGWDVAPEGVAGDTAGDEFEICEATKLEECQSGERGSGVGQISWPFGIAVDGAGAVYALDLLERRVQKFDSEGNFELMFGGEVNKTKVESGTATEAEENRCPIDPGDECQRGVEGSGDGQFIWRSAFIDREFISQGDYISAGPDDTIYVGDSERIQLFDTEGNHLEDLPDPDGALSEAMLQSLSIGPGGELFISFGETNQTSKEGVLKLDGETGAVSCEIEAVNPRAIAALPGGGAYVFDETQFGEVRRYGSGCAEQPEDRFEPGSFQSTGIAASAACGIEGFDLYVSEASPSPSHLLAYGPPPDPKECPQPPLAPEITAQYATAVGTSSATLNAQINPNFWPDATYYVEYGTEDCDLAPCERALFPGAALTTEVTDEPVAAQARIDGLLPDTTYHFRFVAKSGGGGPVAGPDSAFTTYRPPRAETSCPNQALRGGASAALPDCRAYEMVSPVDKNGGEITAGLYEGFDAGFDFLGLDQSAPGGSRIAYSSGAAFAGAEGTPLVSEYIATRGAESWQTEPLNPPMRGGNVRTVDQADSQYKAFSQDLSTGWLLTESGLPLTPDPVVEGFNNLYRRDNATAAYTWLQSSQPAPEEPEPCVGECGVEPFLFPELQGTTPDQRCAAFRVNDALPSEEPEAPHGLQGGESPDGIAALQLYLRCEGEPLRLASVLPDGQPFEANSSAGSEMANIGATSNTLGRTSTVEGALAADGGMLYWSARSDLGDAGPGVLYVRVNPGEAQSAISGGKCTEPAKACTLQVMPGGFEDLNKAAQFWTASLDGERAIFSVLQGPDQGKLYEYAYDPETGNGTRTEIAGETLGVAGWSEDADRLYFASRQVCSGAKENDEGAVAEEGAANLYLYEAGQSCAAGELELVGALAEEDFTALGKQPSPISPVPRFRISRTSADAGTLAFVSAARLTAFDNTDAASGEPDREVYLYEAATGELRCASCNPSGARPEGERSGGQWVAAWIPGYQHQLYGRRPLSADGERLFFNSIDPLAVRDSNGVQDVYQWEAAGKGGCATSSPSYSEQNEGCISLISSGQSPTDSEFVDASASGDDVFIRTATSLVSADPGSVDIYDARVGGGYPEPSESIACEGDACQSPAPAPEPTTPASALFAGPGNPPPAGQGCAAPARRAAGLSRRARRLRANSRRVRGAHRARRLRRKAARLAGRAKAQSNRAKRCRRARGREGR